MVGTEVVGEHDMYTDNSDDLVIPGWYALYTRSHCEQLVFDQLTARGFCLFLPKIDILPQQIGKQRRLSVPMFPGYLFLHHCMDKLSYIDIRKARGLVRILGERWDKLSVIPDCEIESIRRALNTSLPIVAHPYLQEGQRVRISRGPLTGLEGILIQSKPAKGLLILSVDLLQRSVAVEVDSSMVTAA